jgi:hypothetical protein
MEAYLKYLELLFYILLIWKTQKCFVVTTAFLKFILYNFMYGTLIFFVSNTIIKKSLDKKEDK